MKKTTLFSKESPTIFFHILTKCNLSCYHCYVNPKQHGSFSLDLDTINLWLSIFAKKIEHPNVVFLGGEPTMHPQLHLMVKKARKLGYKSIIIDTNGYNIENVLNYLKPEDVDLFNFSLDGPTAYSNDLLRGNGSYKCCVQSIAKTKKRGFKTGLIFTASSLNFNYLNYMPIFLSKLGVDYFFIQVIGIRGKCANNKGVNSTLKQVDKISWLETIPFVARQVANSGIVVTYPKIFLDTDDVFECSGLVAENYFIFPNGRVYKCPLCEDYPLHGKEIKEGNLVDTKGINETTLFNLTIPEGCVMNKIIQPENIIYDSNGIIEHKIACCMLKEILIP